MRKSASEDVGRQIGTSLAAQRAFGHDPGVRYRHDRRRNVFAAAFTPNGVVADASFRQVPHWNSIGEQKAKFSTVSPLPTTRSECGDWACLQVSLNKGFDKYVA